MDPSEDKIFPLLIDEADLLFVYLDMEYKVRFCNKKTEDVAEKKINDIKGRDWFGVLYPDEADKVKRQMLKAVVDDSIRHKRRNIFQGLIRDSSGNELFIHWNIAPVVLSSGGPEGVLLVGNDISEFKEREASARKIDDTLRNILSSIKEYALYTINLDGNITYYGMGSEAMLGWRKNDIIFKHVSLLHPNDDSLPKLGDVLERVRSAGREEIETELVTNSGHRIPVILNIIQYPDSEGKFGGYIFIAKDITERKKFEYEIFQAEKLAAIGQLAAGMAHEISNPLFVIAGRIELLMTYNELSPEVGASLGLINAQTDRIRKLVDQILKFSRKAAPHLEIVNLNDVIEGALGLVAYQRPSENGITVKKDLLQQGACVKGDFNQLQEVFVNMFLNAYQAMPDTGTLSIRSSSLGDGYLEIRVSDTGGGISEYNMKNMFMPFFSTKKSGTGLGLSICHNIIKSHGGSINIESQLNKGTTFIIKLPFAKEGGKDAV